MDGPGIPAEDEQAQRCWCCGARCAVRYCPPCDYMINGGRDDGDGVVRGGDPAGTDEAGDAGDGGQR